MTYDVSNLKVTEGQRALAAYIKRETGKQVKPESIALVDALRIEFRKDPEQVAKRDAVKAAARERDEAALEKALAKARALAEKLGVSETEVTPVLASDITEHDPAADADFEEPVATVTVLADKRVVENVFGADTSAIEVVESEDAFAVPATTEEDDF
jgi:hypothetical protein